MRRRDPWIKKEEERALHNGKGAQGTQLQGHSVSQGTQSQGTQSLGHSVPEHSVAAPFHNDLGIGKWSPSLVIYFQIKRKKLRDTLKGLRVAIFSLVSFNI